ncbi:TPM domain-containing protein [Halarcobacter ebronensis]|uniref:TPM domain-containing protein n=1 Tax=Halarcobacter ebronensis TaxID=1462615 RepID=A0A4Q1API1_9BACT|nr:TPM domain-containing protein [Halarcobacter ebronensis]QKF83452.1 putative phosphatase (TPM domain) [Halarcobacter ebronensis]RXK08252.1 hypothetical protein CRV07_00130 [Halarcobacter ebronensis]
MKRLFYTLLSLLFLQTLLFATPTFPELTGRVVDDAKILNSSQKQTLTKLLKEEEKNSSNQIIVVTLESLHGYDIADYGYQLGRHWGIGQKDKNNGVLLIVSMAEKKLRIEVGYGLEGALTDKTSHEIIEYIIKPNFRNGNFYEGILKGTKAIIASVKGEYKAEDYHIPKKSNHSWILIYFAIFFISPIFMGIFKKRANKVARFFHALMLSAFGASFAIGVLDSLIISLIIFFLLWVIIFLSNQSLGATHSSSNESIYWGSSNHSGGFGGGFSSGGFSSGSFGGGFSGGGGGFGGGGASGGW